MNNDLISREALRKEVENLVAGGAERLKDYYENGSKKEENEWIGGVYDAWELIDNAPTVEPEINVFCENADDKTKEELKADLKAILDEIRPQGEWKVHGTLSSPFVRYLTCSECDEVRELTDSERICNHRPNYCEWCGAKMKGGAE